MVVARKAVGTFQWVHTQKVEATLFIMIDQLLIIPTGIHPDKAFSI